VGRQAIADRGGREFAARGGLDNKLYAWGDEPTTDAKTARQPWQGKFPRENTKADGYERTAPVKVVPATLRIARRGRNVWEWCADWYQRDLYARRAGRGVVVDPTGPDFSIDAHRPFTPQRVQKGGSFLCNDVYCTRYRQRAARMFA